MFGTKSRGCFRFVSDVLTLVSIIIAEVKSDNKGKSQS